MKKVLCINYIRTEFAWISTRWMCDLTIGKWYDVISEDHYSYNICDDKGYIRNFYKFDNLFITINEHRKKKLEKINESNLR